MTTKTLDTTGAQTLMEEVFEPLLWLVEDLLLSGTVAILASRPKTGKSWLCLQLGLAVTMGQKFMERTTTQTDVLYLCLEDNYRRLQNRLWAIADEATDAFRLTTIAATLANGLLEQIKAHLQAFPETKLVIIDTLQIVRDSSADYSYSADYNDLRAFKKFAEENDICILLVHHLRKSKDPSDSFADISGTTGISGAVDTMMVLKKENRASKKCKLSVTGRDVEYTEINIEHDGSKWNYVDEPNEKEIMAQFVPDCIIQIAHHFSQMKQPWCGTSSELIAHMGLDVPNPSVLGKFLSQHRGYLAEQGIEYTTDRKKNRRFIKFNYAG